MPQTADRQTELTKSLARAMRVLDTLIERGEPMGVTEMANEIGIHKSSAYRLMRTMVEYDILEQHAEDSRYWLGSKLTLLGDMASSHLELPARAEPHVMRLSQFTRETAFFVKIQETRVLYLVSALTDQTLGMIARPRGATDAVYSTACGKAALAHMPPRRAEQLLKRAKFVRRTERTARNADEVLAQLVAVRDRGYAIDDQENDEHVRCIGAPVFDGNGEVIGAVSISGPDFRLTEERIPSAARHVMRCAVDISRGLGLAAARNVISAKVEAS